MDEQRKRETRAHSRRFAGMVVVGFMVLLVLALAYFYTVGGQETGQNVVGVAVRGYLSMEQKQALAMQFERYAPASERPDVTLQLYEFPLSENDPETKPLLEQLVEDLHNGDSDLFLMEESIFSLIADERLFADLAEDYPGDPALRGRYLYEIQDKPFADNEMLQELPKLSFALRSNSLEAVNLDARTLERYEYAQQLLDHIVHGALPEE